MNRLTSITACITLLLVNLTGTASANGDNSLWDDRFGLIEAANPGLTNNNDNCCADGRAVLVDGFTVYDPGSNSCSTCITSPDYFSSRRLELA